MVAVFRGPAPADVEAGPPPPPRRPADRAAAHLRCGLAAAALVVIAALALDPGRAWAPARKPAAVLRSADTRAREVPGVEGAAVTATLPAPEQVAGAVGEAQAAAAEAQVATGGDATVGPAVEPGAEPAAQPVAEPAAQPVAEPAAQHVAEPAAQHVAEPAAQPVAEPAAQPVAEPATTAPAAAPAIASESPGADAARPVEVTVAPAAVGDATHHAADLPASTTSLGGAAAPSADTSPPAGAVGVGDVPGVSSVSGSGEVKVAAGAPAGASVDAVTAVPALVADTENSGKVDEKGREMARSIHMDESVIMMPKGEVSACAKILSDLVATKGSKIAYLEYGSGGSTTEFTQFASKAVSIEHNQEWCSRVGERLVAKSMSHVRQLCVPQEDGEAGRSGRSEGNGISFRTYLNSVDTPGLPMSYDFVYIDGRARLGAALKVLPYLTDDSIVVLHDAVRKRYDGVDRYYETVETVMDWGLPVLQKNGLRIMRRRRDLPTDTWPLSDAQIDTVYSAMPHSAVES